METIRLGARLRAARKAAGFKTSKNFLKASKIPASTYSQHESGARIPDDKFLEFYSRIFSVNFDWLKEGKGLPYHHANIKKTAIDEEMLDLNQFKPNSHINQPVLTSILYELLVTHSNLSSSKVVKKVVSDSMKIYNNVISASSSNKNLMKILKKAVKSYKKENAL